MAKKGKSKKEKEEKEKDENINEGTQEDINEADDSFGLPDIDYKPLDEIEEEPVEEQEPEEEQFEEVDEVADSSEIETPAEDDFEEEFVDDSAEADDSTGEVESVETESSFGTPPRKFEHPEKSSAMPKIIIGVLVAIIVITAGWYFGWQKPRAEKAKQELAEQQRQEEAEAARQREAELQAQRAAEEAAAAEEETMEEEIEAGTMTTITESTGRYYVVVGSFIDVDLATDYGNELGAMGTTTMLLSPSGRGFYRLALSDYESWAEAQSVAEQLKGEYGDKVWVLKY